MAAANIKDLYVIKKDGSSVKFDGNKIRLAVQKSASRVNVELTKEQIQSVVNSVEETVKWRWNDFMVDHTSVESIHLYVQSALAKVDEETYLSYKAYRDYKIKYSKSFQEAAAFSNKVVHEGDKENANKDSSINSTKQALIAEAYMKEMMKNFEMKPEWIKAHDDGYFHIHDLGARFTNQINCCLFDMENLLDGGFEMNGVKYTEPKNVLTAWNVIGDVTLNASSQQYGGFTIGEIDSILSKYVIKSLVEHYDRLIKFTTPAKANKAAAELVKADIRQGYQGFEHKLNTVSNALGQTPFVTLTFGVDTTIWGREVAKAILSERTKGMGADKVTAVFPKLVFMYKDEINGNTDSPNHDIFLDSVECSRTRLYPDYLSYDNYQDNLLAQINQETGKYLVPMGCRAFLSRASNPSTGEEVYTGRNNIGAVTLNIPKLSMLAVNSSKNIIDAMGLLNDYVDKYAEMVWDIHMMTYEKIGKMKGSTNPLMFCEGGAWMKVGYDDPIAPIIELSTASLGYVGLEEAAAPFVNKYGVYKDSFKGIVVDMLSNAVDVARDKYKKLFALYATPAESLVYRFQVINKKEFGIVKNFTDREYMTNSFHEHVSTEINAVDKITKEAPFHSKSTGGRISYTEFPYAVDTNVLLDSIQYAMSKGLYYGVNIVSSSCCDCGHKGDFEICPECNSENVTVVVRVCGYLTFKQTKGDTRLNQGKLSETHDRVKHTFI